MIYLLSEPSVYNNDKIKEYNIGYSSSLKYHYPPDTV